MYPQPGKNFCPAVVFSGTFFQSSPSKEQKTTEERNSIPMKKIIALLLALTLALSLVACGSADQTPSSGEPESSLTSDTNSDQEMESTTEPEGSTQEPETPEEDAEDTDAEKPAENTGSNTGASKPSGGTSTGSSNTSKPSGGTSTGSSKPSGGSSSGNSGSSNKPSEPEKPAETGKSLSDLMTSILSGVETPGYAITDVAAEQYPLYLFIDQPEGAQAVTADSLIGSIAHSVVLMRLPDGADVSGIAQQVKDNADPRKWICVEAEKVIVKTKGNLVLLVMSAADTADAIAANFDALSV